jgi:alanyl-tRNA synthetase
MTSSELRRSFLEYFQRHGHRIVPSSPLVPHGDATLLFTNAGMNQFKDVFLGREQRGYSRATTSQKCMRVSGKHNDLDNVGPSLRHHTFFEMLGNFSFGDYFKHDAIGLAWDLLTTEWGIAQDKLFVTIFKGEDGIPRDDEAYVRWLDFVPADRIAELGAADNFWSMGDTGPCGRCSEIHYFRGNDLPCSAPSCLGPACDCDRFVEIWNNVFMEFDRQPGGQLLPLPKPSIDTGMGLERITAVLAGTLSNYGTDVFRSLLIRIDQAAGRSGNYPDHLANSMEATAVSSRVVADHLRAMTFLIADGVLPSNEWRGYVLRKIMRRAMRHGKRLGFTEPFLHGLASELVDFMGDAYPELRAGRETVVQVIRAEEHRFESVLTNGLPKLEEILERAAHTGSAVGGDDAFRLYDTLGLPLDFIEDLASERKLALDRQGFDRAMAAQRVKARASSAFEGKRAEEPTFSSPDTADRLRSAGEQFDGYTTTLESAAITAVLDANRRQVATLPAGASGYVLLNRTPFYLEAGGQVSDTGDLRNEAGTVVARVEGVVRLGAGLPRGHKVTVIADALDDGQTVTVRVDEQLRDATRRNHTATHLMHAALRQVLGTHVKQAGSLVAPDRLRFDFTHFSPVTAPQLREIEALVNEQILRNVAVTTEVKDTAEAMASGAMALFGEKYGDRVRVVRIPGFSVELCGGTHTRATGEIGLFTVAQESGVAAGVRRIEALTGEGALHDYQSRRETLHKLVSVLGVSDEQAADAAARLQQDIKRLAREVQDLKVKLAMLNRPGTATLTDSQDIFTISGVPFIIRKYQGLGREDLRQLSDQLKDKLGSGGTFLASVDNDRVTLVSSLTADVKHRFHAGNIVKEAAPIVGGKGGGRPDFAEAGGPDTSRVDELLESVPAIIERLEKKA